MLLGLFVSAGAAIYLAKRPRILAQATRLLWSIPAIGERLEPYQLARFTRTLAMLVKAGNPFVSGLDMVRDLLKQAALQSRGPAHKQLATAKVVFRRPNE